MAICWPFDTSRESSEATCFNQWLKGASARKGDVMPCITDGLGERDQRVEVTSSGLSREENSHPVLLTWVRLRLAIPGSYPSPEAGYLTTGAVTGGLLAPILALLSYTLARATATTLPEVGYRPS